MKTLRVIIYRPDKSKAGEFKEVYRFIIDFDDNVSFDFNILLKAFDILCPINKIVEFKIF